MASVTLDGGSFTRSWLALGSANFYACAAIGRSRVQICTLEGKELLPAPRALEIIFSLALTFCPFAKGDVVGVEVAAW
jgi:hypothetical protein